MIRIICSAYATLILILAMTVYLLQGKYLGWSLDPRVMVALGVFLCVQSGAAIVYRLLLLAGKRDAVQGLFAGQSGELLQVNCQNAAGRLTSNGFSIFRKYDEGSICFQRWLHTSRLLEVAAYTSLVFAIASGLLNYGLGISGIVSVSPGGELIDLSLTELNRGFFSKQTEPSLKLRASELTPSISGSPSSITIEVHSKDLQHEIQKKMENGESLSVGRFSLRFTGDFYMAFISVVKGNHDYLAYPLTISKQAGTDDNVYRGRFLIAEPGTQGEGEYIPASQEFRVKVYKDNQPEFDGLFKYGEEAAQGDFRVSVKALSHAGRIEIARYSYKNQVLGGFLLLLVFIFIRLLFRPQMVCLQADGENVRFYTENRSVRRILLRE